MTAVLASGGPRLRGDDWVGEFERKYGLEGPQKIPRPVSWRREHTVAAGDVGTEDALNDSKSKEDARWQSTP